MRYVDHYRGERQQDRRTPREFFDKLNDRFHFTLDGAATKENALLPKFSTETDTRWLSWEGERVFCNPPWSDIPPFIERAATADLAVLLVPARTNCKWFHRALELGAKPEFWQGKLNFSGKWNSPIDCLLLVWGVYARIQLQSEPPESEDCGTIRCITQPTLSQCVDACIKFAATVPPK